MTLEEFIQSTNALLANIESLPEQSIKVIYAPAQSNAQAGELLIGLGKIQSVQDIQNSNGIILQNKFSNSANPSISNLLQLAPDTLIEHFRLQLNSPDSPAAVSRHLHTIYIEDLSADTCLSFLLLLGRLFKVELPNQSIWVDYTTSWELGDVHQTVISPITSYACLVSALAHSYSAALFSPPDEQPDLTQGFVNCIRYTLSLIAAGFAPTHIPEQTKSLQHHQASTAIRYEAQQYKQALKQAHTLQLLLPIKYEKTGARHMLVDAYIAQEPNNSDLTGIKKVFLRSDQENTFFNAGFTFMGLYQPILQGTGNDIVFSLDPSANLSLKQLWQQLEAAENDAWENKRPRDNPRNIASYPANEGPNQPWWDDNGRYTLIAAPKNIQNNQPGSRLNWETVLEKLWALYNPAKQFLVKPQLSSADSEACLLHEIPFETGAAVPDKPLKHLKIAHWQQYNYPFSPTLERYFAACTQPESSVGVLFKNLPNSDSFRLQYYPGGMAVISQAGVVLLNDWSEKNLDIDALKREFYCIVKRLSLLNGLTKQLDAYVSNIKNAFQNGKKIDYRELSSALTQIKIELQTELYATANHCRNSHALAFRETLEHDWSINTELNAFNATLEQLDNTVRNHFEGQTNSLINKISLYGLPFIYLASFFGSTLEHFSLSPDEISSTALQPANTLLYFGLNFGIISFYLLLCAVLSGFLHLTLYFINRRQRRKSARQYEAMKKIINQPVPCPNEQRDRP